MKALLHNCKKSLCNLWVLWFVFGKFYDLLVLWFMILWIIICDFFVIVFVIFPIIAHVYMMFILFLFYFLFLLLIWCFLFHGYLDEVNWWLTFSLNLVKIIYIEKKQLLWAVLQKKSSRKMLNSLQGKNNLLDSFFIRSANIAF